MTALRELLTFGLVGVANTVVGLGTILVLQTAFGIDPFVANAFGYAAGLANSFIMNRAFTFRDGDRSARAGVRFIVAFAAAYSANIVVLAALMDLDPTRTVLWQMVAMVVYTLVFFVLAKFFVFRTRVSS